MLTNQKASYGSKSNPVIDETDAQVQQRRQASGILCPMALLVCLMFLAPANDDAEMALLCSQVYLQPMTLILIATNDVSVAVA